MRVVKSVVAISWLAAVLCCSPALAQQEKGDKEVGVGGQAFFGHNGTFGSMSLQGSFGYYASARNYFGVEVEPSLVFTKVNDVRTTSGEVFVKGNYRRLFGNPAGKVFPFVGGGAGLEELEKLPGSGPGAHPGFSADGFLFAEIGFKSYLSQKTALEFAYSIDFLPAGSGGFQGRTFSQATISIRHIF